MFSGAVSGVETNRRVVPGLGLLGCTTASCKSPPRADPSEPGEERAALSGWWRGAEPWAPTAALVGEEAAVTHPPRHLGQSRA